MRLVRLPDLPDRLTRAQRITAAAAAVAVALSRFAALSKGPWDWDEVLFCLAIGEYDVGAHRPHPPGFPLHVLLGRLARLVAESDFTALQAVSVAAGFAVFPVVFWLARSLRFDFVPALAAATIVPFLPNVWFYGGTAFSDVPAMVLGLGAAAAYLGAGTNTRRSVVAAALAAAGILVRPHNALVLAFPWAAATWQLARARRFRAIAAGTGVALAIVAAGYGWTVGQTGASRLVDAVKAHAEYVATYDSTTAAARPGLLASLRMLLDPYDAGKVSLLIGLLALAGIVLGRRSVVAAILLTFLPQFLLSLVAGNPLGSSRLSLAWIAGLVLLAVEGMAAIGRLVPRARIAAPALLTLAIAGRLVTWVLPAFEFPRETEPPQVQAVLWLRETLPPGVPVVFDHNIEPWVRYYLADRPTIPWEKYRGTTSDTRFARAWFVAVGSTRLPGAIPFQRPHDRIWNIVIHRGFEVFAAPIRSVAVFDEGWYGEETNGVDFWRWARPRSSMTLPPMDGRCEMALDVALPLDVVGPSMRMRFLLNGQPVHATELAEQRITVQFPIEPKPGSANVLRVEAGSSFVPAQRGGDDTRELSWMLWGWRCEPAPAPVPDLAAAAARAIP